MSANTDNFLAADSVYVNVQTEGGTIMEMEMSRQGADDLMDDLQELRPAFIEHGSYKHKIVATWRRL